MHVGSLRTVCFGSLAILVLAMMYPERAAVVFRHRLSVLAGGADMVRLGLHTDSRVPAIAASPSVAAPASAPAPAHVPAIAPAARADYYQVPIGTIVSARLRTAISSGASEVNDQVDAVLSAAVTQKGVELIPAGSMLHGTIVLVEPATRERPHGRIAFAFALVEHRETRSRAPFRTRTIAMEADAPPGVPEGRRASRRQPIDVVLHAGSAIRLTLDAPVVVAIPARAHRPSQERTH